MRIDRNQETNVGGCVSILEKDDSSSVMVAWCELLDRSGGRERERRGHSLCWVFSLFSRLCRVCLFGRAGLAGWLTRSLSGWPFAGTALDSPGNTGAEIVRWVVTFILGG